MHLGYCTNIHQGQNLKQIIENLRVISSQVKERVSPDLPFGIGLWLPDEAASQLQSPQELEHFKQELKNNSLYVFTLNGFPFGVFHNEVVKKKVYLPDWRHLERLTYTKNLALVLNGLLEDGIKGSISTLPLGFKENFTSEKDQAIAARNLLEIACFLIDLTLSTGTTVTLALEPEPGCVLETIEEVVVFFKKYVFTQENKYIIAQKFDVPVDRAAVLLAGHIGVCLDLCHCAIGFENAQDTLRTLTDAGIGIFKIQISSGLTLQNPDHDDLLKLHELDSNTYLHQVVIKKNAGLTRYNDLTDAISAEGKHLSENCEWRIHFHVPITIKDEAQPFQTTQNFICDMLNLLKNELFCDHLEVETYTWSVLPSHLRQKSIVDDISSEINWVKEYFDT
ncbi:metabolite traffic protein EboE [Terasakiella sp. SH-1]|uniref:metabolite traffic protein EboE n=1 Tax=Terasakiella sp. SH-1 TaxID=2560057 RepID=UPI0010745532|nr:metabolite traffic protein EboE [Terasakiella sp. SH-1]